MKLDELVHKLKRHPRTRFPFVTQYVNAHWTEEFRKKQTVLFFKNQWNDTIDRIRNGGAPNDVVRSLEDDRARIEQRLRDAMRGTIDSEYKGLAFFACSGGGFFEVFGSHVEFEDQIVVDRRPHLKQLARLADEYEAVMLIMIDSSRARVYELKLAGVDDYFSMTDDVPGRHKAGGWSQMRFQRHVQDHRDRHHKAVARAVVKLFDSRNMKNVVIAGQNDVIAEFARFLPGRVLDKVFATIHLDMIEPEETVIMKVLEHLHEHERATESRGVRQAVEQAAIGGRGAVGLLATLRAVNERLVQVLYLSERFAREGGRCPNCRLLSARPGQCPYCSDELVTVELGEAMVDAVIEAGGEINMVEENDELGSFEGVAAATRSEKRAPSARAG
jgi:peptide chain release factor subunit 1